MMKKRRVGVLAQKIGMTRVFQEDGTVIPVTVLKMDRCCIVAVKQYDHHVSLQVGAGVQRRPNRPTRGIFEKIGMAPCAKLKEFPVSQDALLPVGSVLKPSHFPVGGAVDVSGVTIGRGFAGGMKRHGFSGLRATHGVSASHRSHGSTGNRKDPGRVFKNKKMAGHMGCEHVTIQNLSVVQVLDDQGLIVVRGAVPGHDQSWVVIRDAIKKNLSQAHVFPGVFDALPSSQNEDSKVECENEAAKG